MATPAGTPANVPPKINIPQNSAAGASLVGALQEWAGQNANAVNWLLGQINALKDQIQAIQSQSSSSGTTVP